jgi:hypothetical protein
VAPTEQLTIDREVALRRSQPWIDRRAAGGAAERAARESLRAQIAKLEHELSGLVARRFPHIAPVPALASAERSGPHLLSLAELERLRDRLVQRVHRAQQLTLQRAEHELRSRDLLERMQEEPGRYKFVRLPVTDLGESGCGVWEVRPRLGLLGMLAGWWQLKLSSGCPLPEAARPARAAAHGAEAARFHARLQLPALRNAACPRLAVRSGRASSPVKAARPITT